MSGEITKPISDNTLRVLHINWMSWPEFKGGHVVHCSRLIETLSQLNTKQAYLFSGYGSSGEVPRLRKYRKKDEHVDFYQIINATGPVNIPSVDNRNPRIESIVLDVIKDYSPHLVHIHHMIGFPASTIERIKETFNIPVVITIRDFWYICPLVQLLKVNHEICRDNSKGEGCRDCFQHITGLSPSKTGHRTWSGEFEARKTAWIRALNLADQISAVSSYIKNIYVTEGVSPNKMHVISAGVPNVLKKLDENKIASAKFKIGFLGTISTLKGANVLLKALDQWKDPDISLELWGSLSDDDIRLQLEKNDDKRVSVFGPYESDDLTKILSNFDVGIIPSIWPDTAPQVIFEFFSMKIPVVASKIGGIPDFIYHEKNGLLFEPNNASDLLHALKRLKNDNKLLKRLSKNIKPQKSLINYAGEILSVYKKAIKINQEPNGLCVELGGGETPRKKESGFINIDYRISPQVELVANVKDLPIKNGSLEKIYCANLSEHFERSDIQKVLLEWWRVLRPGGWIDVMVPDLEGTLDNWRDIPYNRVLDALYGAQKFEGDYHFNGFTERSLKQVLYRSGFSYSSQVIKWIFDSVPRIQIRAHKKPKISLFPLGDTSIGSSRLRLHRLYPSLVKMGYKVNLFGDLKECDVAIFQKVFDRDLFKKCTGVKILDIDDNYFENGSLVHQCRAAAKSASAIVTSTPELGNIASKYSNASIYTVPTGIDVVQLDNLDIKAPQKVKLIGWVGYPENVVYLEKILPVIRELSIRLRVISRRTEEVDIWLNRNADIVEFREWSILTADGFLKECDMGVAPLSNDGWAQTKSAVKILKYWALGLPVVCSPSPEYSRIEEGTGSKFIAHNQKEWKELIQSKKNVRLKQVEQAKNLLSKYSNENLSKKWNEIIQSALYDEYLKRENIKGKETNNSKVNIEDKKVQIISHRKNPDKNNGEIYSKDRILEKKSVVRYSVHENTELKRCSIIIPIYNKIELTKHCLKALYRATNPELFEVILIDNGSTDGTKKYIESLNKNVSIIYNKNNMGFASACNQGAKTSKCEYLLFLNNDTEVLQNWLEPLLKIVDRDREVVAVGSKLLFPDRTIQHAGVVIINDKKISDPLVARHIYYGQREDLPDANRQLYYQVLTAACLLIRREHFEKVEGFDERYWNGYEDVDLCFKFQENGWNIVYQPESVVIHHESKSGTQRFIKTQENIELLHKKWIGKITPDIIIESDGKIRKTAANYIQEYLLKQENVPQTNDPENSVNVSIIILTLNQIDYTRQCIESILRCTRIPIEIIVVDNGSTDETIEYLNSVKENIQHDHQITIISNNENLGFAGGNNIGLSISKGCYALLINNDVVVTPGWLERLIETAERSPKIGIVGPMSNNVSGPQLIQNIGYNPETLEGLERYSENLSIEKAGKTQQILRVVGFCMLIKRTVINKIGGMDHRFGLGNFEDDDFSLRAALAGFESWMVEDCFVHHYGSRTFIGEKIDHGKSLHKNWEIFKEKWGLPSGLPYGSPYSLSQMKITGFDLKIPYISISANDYNSFQNCPKNFATVDQEYSVVCSNIEKKDLKVAIEKLKGFAKRYVDYALVYNDMGVLFFQKGDNESALKNYQMAVKLNPQNINFKKNLADLLSVTFGELEEALQHYVAVLASYPKDVEALSATGHICARLERYDDAAEFYERVLEIEPENSDAKNWLTKMEEKASANCMEVNLNDRYLALLSEIDHEDLAGAIQKIEKFLEMYPKHGQANNDLGVLYYKNESKTKVLASYLKAVELEPENVTFRKNLADFLYVEEGRVEEALENYAEVLLVKPDEVETLLVTGHICTSIDRYEDAMSFYNRVLNIEPGNIDARKNLEVLERRQISMLYKEERDEEKTDGAAEINQAEPQASVDELTIVKDGVVEELINKADLLFQQERIDQAVDAMLKAIAVNQLDGRTYIELARQLINHGSNENALEVLAEMPANQPEALEKQKLVLEGYCQEGMGNYAAAKKCNDGVLAREPKNAKALNLRGILSYRNGDKETAEQHFKRAIELDSEYGEPHTNLGALVWENGKPKMALEHYELGFSISPTDIDVANAYHEAVTATGEYKRAEKAARSALKKYPQCRKVLYLLVDTLIRQEKNEEALKELETALSSFGVNKGLLDTAIAFRERVGKIKKTVSSKKPGVSLCMIVKDEEANLAHCLASVKPIVDEMVVVDTGSTDRTRDIAEFFCARVYDFEWTNDFAAARNFSISKAKGDWILIMDADEVISPMDYDHFRKLTAKKSEKPVAYSVATRNYCHEANTIGWYPNDGHYVQEEAGFGWLLSEKVRLFSNRKKIKFEGAVHEMVDPVLKRIGIKIKKSAIPVHHYGRLNTDLLNKKRRIYYEIGQKKLAENGSSIGAIRELAIQATALEKNSEAIKLWTKFLSMKPDSRSVPEAYVNMGSAYIRMKDYEKALISAQKAVAIRPEMKEAQYNLGMAELYNGNADAAVMTLKKLIKSYPNFPPAQFLFAASNCCKNDSPDRNGELKALKRSSFGRVLTYSVAELAEGLMSADQHKLALKLLLHAIEEEIVSKDIMNLYGACIKKNEDSRNLGGKIPEEADVLQETIVE